MAYARVNFTFFFFEEIHTFNVVEYPRKVFIIVKCVDAIRKLRGTEII